MVTISFFYTLHSVIAIGGVSMNTKEEVRDLFRLFDFPINREVEKAINKYFKNKRKKY